MRFVITSDWHADAVTEGVVRSPEIARSVHISVDHTIALKASGVEVTYIFCGDLADPHCVRSHGAVALAVGAATGLAVHDIDSYWMAGNHDVVEDGSGDHVLMALKDIERAHVLDYPRVSRIGGEVHLVSLPFTATCNNYDPEQYIRDVGCLCVGEPTLVIGHLNLQGISAGSETKDMPRGRDVYWPLDVIGKEIPHAVKVAGHYHDPQVFKGVHVVGSLARLSFGETSDAPGFLDIEVS